MLKELRGQRRLQNENPQSVTDEDGIVHLPQGRKAMEALHKAPRVEIRQAGSETAYENAETVLLERQNPTESNPTKEPRGIEIQFNKQLTSSEQPTELTEKTFKRQASAAALNEAQASDEKNSRLHQAKQLARSLGLQFSEQLTDTQIDAAVQSVTQEMNDDDKELTQDRATRLKAYLNDTNPQRQASAAALNETSTRKEAQPNDPIARRDELLRRFGLDGRQLVTASDVVDQVREINNQTSGLTPEIIQTQQEVNRQQGRQLIDLLREYPVGAFEERIANTAYVESGEDRARLSADMTQEEDMLDDVAPAKEGGFVEPSTEEQVTAVAKRMQSVARATVAAREREVANDMAQAERDLPQSESPTLEPDIETATEVAQTVREPRTPASAQFSEPAEVKRDFETAQSELKRIAEEVNELTSLLSELKQKEGVLASAARRLTAFMRKQQAPRPEGKVPTAAELKETETTIDAVENALKHNRQALDEITDRVARMAERLVTESRHDLLQKREKEKNKPVNEEPAKAEENAEAAQEGQRVEPVQLLSAEQLAQKREEAVDAFYAQLGTERPTQTDYLRPLAEMFGVPKDTINTHLPRLTLGMKEMNTAKAAALAARQESLEHRQFGKQYADEQMVIFEQYLKSQGMDLQDPNIRTGLDKARQAFLDEAMQQELTDLDGKLRTAMEKVTLLDKASTRLRILEQLGIQETGRIGFSKPDVIQRALNNRLNGAEYGKDRNELRSVLKHNVGLLERVETYIADIEKRNHPEDSSYQRRILISRIQRAPARNRAAADEQVRRERDKLAQLPLQHIETLQQQSAVESTIKDPQAWAERMEMNDIQTEMESLTELLHDIGISTTQLQDSPKAVVFDTTPLLNSDPAISLQTQQRLLRIIALRQGEYIPMNADGNPDPSGTVDPKVNSKITKQDVDAISKKLEELQRTLDRAADDIPDAQMAA